MSGEVRAPVAIARKTRVEKNFMLIVRNEWLRSIDLGFNEWLRSIDLGCNEWLRSKDLEDR
jgi:hypothetical protein